MNQPVPNPAPAKPSPAVVHEVAGKPAMRRAIISLVIGALTGLPALAIKFQAIPGLHLPAWVLNASLIISAITVYLTPFLNSVDSADSSARVQESLNQHVETTGGQV